MELIPSMGFKIENCTQLTIKEHFTVKEQLVLTKLVTRKPNDVD